MQQHPELAEAEMEVTTLWQALLCTWTRDSPLVHDSVSIKVQWDAAC